ncbi:MAG TPA: OmpA family protein, partial [Chitinophagales bacterium]|nr:OmpA family protein [Chitinophagales bacterium]
MRNFIITGIFCFTFFGSYSQVVTPETASKKARKYFDEGIQLAMGSNFKEAAEAFKQAVTIEPEFITAYIYGGDSYQQSGMHTEAEEFLEKAIELQDDYDVGVYIKIARSEQMLMKYEEAYDHIQIFLAHPDIVGETKRKAELLLKSIEFAKDAVQHPVEFKPINLGSNVNSEHSEYFPSISADNSVMIFTRNIQEEVKLESGGTTIHLNEDFFITENINGIWSAAINMGKPVNSKLNEGAQNISADGKWLFYTLCNSPEGFGSCDIYYSLKIGDDWTYPENAGRNINSGNWDSQPSVSADGKYLFYTSNRPGGLGGADIYISKMDEDGYWEKPVNAGSKINTPEDDKSPFIHPDGITLYFSSSGHPGMGGSDLFFIKKDENGEWQTPVNLGYPINTSGDETTLNLSADGNTAYFASDRFDALGLLDLYSFDVPTPMRPEPVTYVKAIVKDARTKKTLKAEVKLMNLKTGKEVLTTFSDEKNGEFLVILPIGNEYGLFVQKQEYLFHSENFSLENVKQDEPYTLEIFLQPVSSGEIITLRNIFFNTASAELLPESETELNKAVELLQLNNNIKVRINGHTDNVGSESENLQLSINRALAVEEYLINAGIAKERLSHQGFGETKPIDSNETDAGRATNRRTELEIISL